MDPSLYRKIYFGSALAGLVILLLFPAEIFGFLFDFFHSLIDFLVGLLHHLFVILMELGHIVFELIESSLDHLVEHLFHTDLHTTQTIVFYIMLFLGIYIGYQILIILIAFSRRCTNKLQDAYSEYKFRAVSYWNAVDSFDKIKWIAILGGFLYLIFLVSF